MQSDYVRHKIESEIQMRADAERIYQQRQQVHPSAYHERPIYTTSLRPEAVPHVNPPDLDMMSERFHDSYEETPWNAPPPPFVQRRDIPQNAGAHLAAVPNVDGLIAQYITPGPNPNPGISRMMMFAPGEPDFTPITRGIDVKGRRKLLGMDVGVYGYPTMVNFADRLLAEHESFLEQCNGDQEVMDKAISLRTRQAFLAAVRLPEGGESLLIDTGAVDALAGEDWFKSHMIDVEAAGLGHLVTTRPTSLMVSGVGKDAEECKDVVSVPGQLEDGSYLEYEAPRIPNSSVPALCGMDTLDKQNMGITPWNSQLVKVPKGKEHLIQWPEGTTFIQCQRAKTGHMMLPIGHFRNDNRPRSGQPLPVALAFKANAEKVFREHQAVLSGGTQSSDLSMQTQLVQFPSTMNAAVE